MEDPKVKQLARAVIRACRAVGVTDVERILQGIVPDILDQAAIVGKAKLLATNEPLHVRLKLNAIKCRNA